MPYTHNQRNRNAQSLCRRKHRPDNPYQKAPVPIPLDGFGLRASEIFNEYTLANHLGKNAEWLQHAPRTSEQIEVALFHEYSLAGMEPEEVRQNLNHAIFDAGYHPVNCDSSEDNPTWLWLEGKSFY